MMKKEIKWMMTILIAMIYWEMMMKMRCKSIKVVKKLRNKKIKK